MTPTGVEVLRSCEGCRLEAYPDPESVLARACRERDLQGSEYRLVPGWEAFSGHPWTVGYGCTGAGIGPGTKWSLVQADAALMVRIKETEAALAHALAWFSKLERDAPVRADCLVNLAFNLGVDGLLRWSITLKAVEDGRFGDAATDILANHLWCSQVGSRAERVANAMKSGNWA